MSTVCIVGGCGHVGLPLGIFLAQNGLNVTLYDLNEASVAQVNQGGMPFEEREADQALPEVLAAGRLRATCSPEVIAEQDTVIVTVGTPVDEFLNPSIRTFDRTLDCITGYMVPGQLLILRSTVFPGVSERLSRRLEERGLEIDIAFCPERIAQGYALQELGQHPQIVAGVTPQATNRASMFFRSSGVKILTLEPAEAELAKLFCNAYRYINFSIANQFYTIAENFGADFFKIHEAVTTDYPRMKSFPKPGFAGGPCLFKDTMQLAAFNHNSFVLGQAAMMVNEGLPKILVDKAKKQHDLSKCRAAILGMAFKGNCDDPRDSLAYKLWKLLELECHEVVCTDPYIKDPRFVSLDVAVARADIVFIGASHDEYRNLQLAVPVVDPFGFMPATIRTGHPERRAA